MQTLDLAPDELIIDNFACGGGASKGIEMALGRSPDYAINHDPEAIALHTANHPATTHLCEDIWDVNPRELIRGVDGAWRRVGLVHLSPDCKHFSKAKGGKPVSKKIRGLAWIAMRWASLPGHAKPRVMTLENVEEFTTWGPLVVDETGNARPCPRRKGYTFRSFVKQWRRHGFNVEWRERRAYKDGAPTIRRRLFIIARSDGQPIAWPEDEFDDPKSSAVQAGHAKPWRTAADCIDWSIPCPSIFATEEEAKRLKIKRPLAYPTQARIARGIDRFTLRAAQPFIVPITHSSKTGRPDGRVHDIGQPLRTITTTAFMVQQNGGPRNTAISGHAATDPLSTIQSSGSQQTLATANMIKLRGTATAQGLDSPAPTIAAQGQHEGLSLASLVKYYGEGGQDQGLDDPMHTATAKARFGLTRADAQQQNGLSEEQRYAAWWIARWFDEFVPEEKSFTPAPRRRLLSVALEDGSTWVIVDIGMRMLTPRELYRAQGFPDSYIIEIEVPRRIGKKTVMRPLPIDAQNRMCGNSVPPPMMRAIIAANFRRPPPCFSQERVVA